MWLNWADFEIWKVSHLMISMLLFNLLIWIFFLLVSLLDNPCFSLWGLLPLVSLVFELSTKSSVNFHSNLLCYDWIYRCIQENFSLHLGYILVKYLLLGSWSSVGSHSIWDLCAWICLFNDLCWNYSLFRLFNGLLSRMCFFGKFLLIFKQDSVLFNFSSYVYLFLLFNLSIWLSRRSLVFSYFLSLFPMCVVLFLWLNTGRKN